MKNKFFTLFLTLSSFALAAPAFAQNTGQIDFWVAKVFEYARMGVTFLMIVATLYFIWTVIGFITTADAAKRADKRKQMVAGIIGLFVIVSVWGIIYFVGNTLGVQRGSGSNLGLPCPPGTRAIGPAGSCI
ncbi:MAG TPA: hypothetical protein VLB02_00640 [Candidatus Paceibacterota bacterium]|nr:hypothetical protein [Candidatus Paceibacterota bacterium]